MIQRPIVTEKSNIGREEQNIVTLAVDPSANKKELCGKGNATKDEMIAAAKY